MSNSEVKIVFENQDHTFGNLIRSYLLKDSKVLFAGYRIIHPLDNKLLLNIKTKESFDSYKILQSNINLIKHEIQSIKEEFLKSKDKLYNNS